MTEVTHPPIAIIILTWNGLELTKICFETLRAHCAGANYRIIVVDNGSSDGTLEWLREQPDLTLVVNDENMGFIPGYNQALRLLGPGEDALLLNNDMEILDAGWLGRLQAAAYSSSQAGVVGCRLVNGAGLLPHAGS